MADRSARGERRFDLDWIRIAVFGLLILYHVGMVFVPWHYHVKSTHLVPELLPFMLALNPWRLSLLFLVAGAATRFMAQNATPGAMIRNRSLRLLPPLLFGMAIIVPSQSYWEVVLRHLYSADFTTFYSQQYFAFAKKFCSNGPCIVLPTWNHLWFVAYLWVYTLVGMMVVTLAPAGVRRAEALLEQALPGIGLFLWPALVFAAYRVALFPHFPASNALVGDWYNHALYFSMFALGYLMARADAIWDAMMRGRWVAVAISAALFGSHYWPTASLIPAWEVYERGAYGIYQWCCIVAVLGFGRRWTSRDSAARRYLTEAIFPYYIVHQTVIIGVAFALHDLGLSALQEAIIILSATVAACAASYEIVRRIAWLRPLFGLRYRAALA